MNPRKLLLLGVALMLLGALTAFVVFPLVGAGWVLLAGIGTALAGLLTAGSAIAPGRSSFHGGTKIWQNDGVPGGGGGVGM